MAAPVAWPARSLLELPSLQCEALKLLARPHNQLGLPAGAPCLNCMWAECALKSIDCSSHLDCTAGFWVTVEISFVVTGEINWRYLEEFCAWVIVYFSYFKHGKYHYKAASSILTFTLSEWKLSKHFYMFSFTVFMNAAIPIAAVLIVSIDFSK